MTRIVSQNSHLEQTEYKTLGLDALVSRLQGDRKYFILDLGQALGVNVEFWSRFQCRLYIEDFYRSYSARVASGPDDPKETILAELLPFSEEARFDIILAWDLFNYLNLEEIEALVGRLDRWCRPGTLLFTLLSYLPQIPAEPFVFRILDTQRMIYETSTRETRPCPRYQPRDLVRFLARFDVSSCFLLRHGVQEFIFAYRDDPKR
ncbi:MAG: class I SAM-dependent methyltransferase [Acidobacteriia bacterium]|nr:class I SAM-dependent methyltransferase [Terriglobia bacterium]